jgi:acyl-CoA synthetase (AMP-forming)/AMP-acid ligase II
MSARSRTPSTLWHAFLSTLRSQNGTNASNPALLSPQQGIKWSYEDLHAKVRGLSRGLQDRGVQKGSVVVTDLPNVAEGLVLHLACARLGAAVATAKNAEMLKGNTFPDITCAVVTPDASSWLSQQVFRAPHIVAGQDEMESMLNITTTSEDSNNSAFDDDTDEHAIDRPLGYFASSNALTHGDALQQGRTMEDYFGMGKNDRVCVSITLYHAFGIGSACSSAIQTGSAIVLPAVGGLQGCGVPSQRAEVTLQTVVGEECTLLFADTHTIHALHNESLSKALQDANLSVHLRGGVCKTGSGTEILTETVDLAGVTLATLGKKN